MIFVGFYFFVTLTVFHYIFVLFRGSGGIETPLRLWERDFFLWKKRKIEDSTLSPQYKTLRT